jgi:DNA-binding CsgD family transcriptional regulator
MESRSRVDEAAASLALQRLGAEGVADALEAVSSLTAALGFARYLLLDIRGGGSIAGLYHNAPPSLARQLDDLDALAAEPVVSTTRAQRIPFLWGVPGELEPGQLLQAHAAEGYKTGIGASNWSGASHGALLVMSEAGDGPPEQDQVLILGYASLAATLLLQVFERARTAAVPTVTLTERERDCLVYVLAGYSGKETARGLGIGTRTVSQYLERARIKLRAQSSYEAATIAVRRGILDMQRATDLIERTG